MSPVSMFLSSFLCFLFVTSVSGNNDSLKLVNLCLHYGPRIRQYEMSMDHAYQADVGKPHALKIVKLVWLLYVNVLSLEESLELPLTQTSVIRREVNLRARRPALWRRHDIIVTGHGNSGVFRHGDRAPVVTYPKNPNNISTTWPDGLGWLTEEGIKMEYSLGRFLRRRYEDFLNERYSPTELTVTSSDLDRCLMSAYSCLAGLYPPNESQELNKNISWQPIPVHTRPKYEDNMLAIDKPCPRYTQLYDASLKSDRIKREEAENKDFYDFIKNETGVKYESIDDIWKIVDTLYCEKQHNVTTPSWANDTIYDRLLELWRMNFDLLYQGKEESRLMGGPLLKEWLRVTQKKIDESSNYTIKMNLYSAHDTTDVALLNALQVYNHMLLPYTTAIIMELHQGTQGDYYVQLFLRNHSSTDENDDTKPFNLTIPGCAFQCPWDQFVSLTKGAIPGDWDAECSISPVPSTEIPGPEKLAETDYKTAFIATVVVFSVVVLLLVAGVALLYRKRGNQKASFTQN